MVQLTKADVRRALVRYHFAPCEDMMACFRRLRSIQFDPIAPVGCNHDLVLQARVPGYQIGDWQKVTYDDRLVYDGWDKQACLVPYSGWPARRLISSWYREAYGRIFRDHPHAVEAILKELEVRGPLLPRECEFQERKEEWKDSWHGPNLAKQTLRALWHAGMVMTADRRGGHHVYDLTERVVPPEYFKTPEQGEADAFREIVLDRHVGMGILRPNAGAEIWGWGYAAQKRRGAIAELVGEGRLVPVDVEGVKAHATPEFISHLDEEPLAPRVVFLAPLDQFMWDRKMTLHLFGFEYIWEIYTPEAKRRWGYYVLPVLFGDRFVGRIEFWCRTGILEVRQWHEEDWDGECVEPFREALRIFMGYCSATRVKAVSGVPKKLFAGL